MEQGWLRMEKIDTDYRQNWKVWAKFFKPFNLDVNPLNQVFGDFFFALASPDSIHTFNDGIKQEIRKYRAVNRDPNSQFISGFTCVQINYQKENEVEIETAVLSKRPLKWKNKTTTHSPGNSNKTVYTIICFSTR